MENRSKEEEAGLAPAQWSTRFLILSLAGIFFLTLLPFRFNFHAVLPGNRSPFLLAGWGKYASQFDELLNILLFIPFGFAFTDRFLRRRGSKTAVLMGAFAAGALLSYSIEFLQIYVPSRDSGWGDIFTNTAGSVLGCLLYEVVGAPILRFLSSGESALAKLLTWPRFGAAIPLYFAFWLAVSAPLQQETRLSNWDPAALLLIGNDASGEYGAAWEGEVYSLQLWDRPLDRAAVEQLVAAKEPRLDERGLLAWYDLSAPRAAYDQMNRLPRLGLVSKPDVGRWRQGAAHPTPFFDGNRWLASSVPVANLVRALQKTNQFTVRVVCRADRIGEMNAAIVSVSGRSGIADIEIAQDDANLDFVFRSPIAAGRYSLPWVIPGVFAAHRVRDLVFSYDGSSAFAYVDGQAAAPYRLGPGTALARYFRHIKTGEMDGYAYIYYALIFFLGGIFTGIAWRNLAPGNVAGQTTLVATSLAPAFLLEAILVSVSGRPVSGATVLLSLALLLAGSMWINADRRPGLNPRP
jgi:hypothetical protein